MSDAMEDENRRKSNIYFFNQEIKNAKSNLKKAKTCLKSAKEINDDWKYNLDKEFEKAFDALDKLLDYVITDKDDMNLL
ncbi:MAG: hypothetical protein ISS41_09835 [Candidatus Aminicenantes bacterium]|nr:hypothetical protein [Candidatus Aminicenantes bacterium]